MRHARAAVMAMILTAGSLAGTASWADRGYYRGPAPRFEHHHHGPRLALGAGLVLGTALLWAATRPPPAPVYVAPEPVVVIPPRAVAAPAAPAGGEWWYYCRPAGAYYPYVQNCPTGWEVVPAQPGGW